MRSLQRLRLPTLLLAARGSSEAGTGTVRLHDLPDVPGAGEIPSAGETMRTESAYIFNCAECGAHTESHLPEGVCPGCGRLFEIASGDGVTADDRR